ncbi:hypothetical protein BDZ89DRAFT_1145034 [Hymenopellis radicata]|nr:hypothetical protein BDZ89DRAFT_1145034 [Hymenopellis radicata]
MDTLFGKILVGFDTKEYVAGSWIAHDADATFIADAVKRFLVDSAFLRLEPTLNGMSVTTGDDLLFLSLEIRDNVQREALRKALLLPANGWQRFRTALRAFAKPLRIEHEV